MATKAKKSGGKIKSVPLTLYDVTISYPELHDPKPFKGKTYYRVDAIYDKNSKARKDIRAAVEQIAVSNWGADKEEWPRDKHGNLRILGAQNGDTREDQKGYAGRYFSTVKTQNPVQVIDLKGKAVNPKLVRGGMIGNVAVTVSLWENEGDEGISTFLNGVQIDPTQEFEAFGGGRSIKQMFGVDGSDEDEESDDQDGSDDEDEAPSKSKKKPARDEDEDEDEPPVKKKKRPVDEDEDDSDDEDEDEPPVKKKGKKAPRDFDEDEDY